MSSPRDLDTGEQPSTEPPPFVFWPGATGSVTLAAPPGVRPEPPGDGRPPAPEPPRARRWTAGHTVAAAVVAAGVLVSGGVAVAARDSATTTPGLGRLPGGQGGFPGGRPGLPGQGWPAGPGGRHR